MNRECIENALRKNLDWFYNSSIMFPADGRWGVAERIFQVSAPELKKDVFNSFNSWTDYGDWSVIESRRPDCNFQTAYLFILASEVFRDSAYFETAENILEFLYCRSGLLNRNMASAPKGAWNWSHTQWCTRLWLDDNSWGLAFPLLIEKKFPGLAQKFSMRQYSELLADSLYEGFARSFRSGEYYFTADCYDPQNVWFGRPLLPHWGSLSCMALSFAWDAGMKKEEYKTVIHQYHKYLESAYDKLNVSEYAYGLIGASAAAETFREPLYFSVMEELAKRIISKMDPVNGNIPAEHYEAPKGAHLVDTIYTANWILLGLQNCLAVSDKPEIRDAFRKILNLILKIQDKSESSTFRGCWRGMYDMNAETWGGGDSYEGGAGSTYSGWTNAPISIVLANELLGKSLIK